VAGRNASAQNCRLIPLKGMSKRQDKDDGVVVESGTIGDKSPLKWEVYTYGTIHIYDPDNGLVFKKDCDLFEEALKVVPTSLKPGEKHVIKASGDNADLVIENVDGEYKLSLTRRGLAVVEKLQSLVNMAKGLRKKNK